MLYLGNRANRSLVRFEQILGLPVTNCLITKNLHHIHIDIKFKLHFQNKRSIQTTRTAEKVIMASPNLKGVFVGSGSDGMQEAIVNEKIVALTGKTAKELKVVYLGTATYDLDAPFQAQAGIMLRAGADVRKVDFALKPLAEGEANPTYDK